MYHTDGGKINNLWNSLPIKASPLKDNISEPKPWMEVV